MYRKLREYTGIVMERSRSITSWLRQQRTTQHVCVGLVLGILGIVLSYHVVPSASWYWIYSLAGESSEYNQLHGANTTPAVNVSERRYGDRQELLRLAVLAAIFICITWLFESETRSNFDNIDEILRFKSWSDFSSYLNKNLSEDKKPLEDKKPSEKLVISLYPIYSNLLMFLYNLFIGPKLMYEEINQYLSPIIRENPQSNLGLENASSSFIFTEFWLPYSSYLLYSIATYGFFVIPALAILVSNLRSYNQNIDALRKKIKPNALKRENFKTAIEYEKTRIDDIEQIFAESKSLILNSGGKFFVVFLLLIIYGSLEMSHLNTTLGCTARELEKIFLITFYVLLAPLFISLGVGHYIRLKKASEEGIDDLIKESSPKRHKTLKNLKQKFIKDNTIPAFISSVVEDNLQSIVLVMVVTLTIGFSVNTEDIQAWPGTVIQNSTPHTFTYIRGIFDSILTNNKIESFETVIALCEKPPKEIDKIFWPPHQNHQTLQSFFEENLQ